MFHRWIFSWGCCTIREGYQLTNFYFMQTAKSGDKKFLNKSILVLIALVAIFVLLILTAAKNGTQPETNMVEAPNNAGSETTEQAIVNVNGKNLLASVASTNAQRERGLSNTHFINENNGMFFVFEEADSHGIWMKDMQFNIDIVWVDADNQIVDIEENVSPSTYPKVFSPDVPSKYVLEVMAGWVAKNHVQIGDNILVTPVKK